MTRVFFFATLAALALVGCATPRGIVPEHPKERYSLPSWPRQSLSLEVVDARNQKEDSDRLVQVTTAILSEALATGAAPPGPLRRLHVEIVLHDVSLNGPMWIATTRFRATLFEGEREVGTWDARGEERRMNWVPANARDAAQTAYERGLASLMTKLESSPP
ncbi:MAG TPA: hypothetical protein VK548_29635 [Candidatus Acidoferrum sp.]|nr:hypothetical protein [Candidatus Acidoferrum sp.]